MNLDDIPEQIPVTRFPGRHVMKYQAMKHTFTYISLYGTTSVLVPVPMAVNIATNICNTDAWLFGSALKLIQSHSCFPPPDTSLRDGLFHEYKKHGKVTSVNVFGQSEDRYAIVSFKK